MTAPTNHGGPAFPHERQIRCNGEVIDHENMPGMSLRDWFAGQALQGIIFANAKHDSEIFKMMAAHDAATNRNMIAESVADAAWKYADALLAARKEQP